jgi:Zn-dependent protease/predicted transcriptional regulator
MRRAIALRPTAGRARRRCSSDPLLRGDVIFGKRFKILTLFGFPIYIDWSWFIIALLILWTLAAGVFPRWVRDLPAGAYWAMGAAGAVGLFVCILLHELGHALVARRFDVHMRGITLFIFGGVAEMGGEPPNARAEFLVAIGGPIVSVVLAGLGFAAVAVLPEAGNWQPVEIQGQEMQAYFASQASLAAIKGTLLWLAVINTVLVVFNAIPAFPLDGGRVLRAILWHVKQDLRAATAISSRIGAGFGAVLIGLALLQLFVGNFIGAMWWFLIGMFIRGAAHMSYQQVLVKQTLGGEPVRRFMTSDPVTIAPDVPLQQVIEDYVYEHHHKLFPVAQNGELRGCLTTEQIKQVPREQWSQRTAGDIAEACSDRNTIGPDADAMKALGEMNRRGVSRMLVVEDGRLVGVLSVRDLMDYLSVRLDIETDGAQPMAAAQAAQAQG